MSGTTFEKEQSQEQGVNNEHVKIPDDKKAKKNIGMIAVVIGALFIVYFLANILGSSSDPVEKEDKTKDTSTVSIDTRKTWDFGNNEDDVSLTETEDKTHDTPTQQPPFLLGDPDYRVSEPSERSLAKSSKGFMIKSGANSSTGAYDTAIQNAENQLAQEGQQNSRVDDIYNAPVFNASSATKSAYNPHLLLSQGTLIQCILRGKLVSNISGQISCTITDNVLSSSGNVVLIEKGSRVNGYYQGASASHGSSEIFAVWQEIRTPNNLVIPLHSGSTDELGANGLRGWADNHFWDRFKNAILLSIVKDVSGALASRASKDGRNDYTENTRDGSEDIAKTILDQMGDIRPTIYKNQGDKVGIFVARDIDFSSVYKLER